MRAFSSTRVPCGTRTVVRVDRARRAVRSLSTRAADPTHGFVARSTLIDVGAAIRSRVACVATAQTTICAIGVFGVSMATAISRSTARRRHFTLVSRPTARACTGEHAYGVLTHAAILTRSTCALVDVCACRRHSCPAHVSCIASRTRVLARVCLTLRLTALTSMPAVDS